MNRAILFLLFPISLLIALTSCKVVLISAYDEQVDLGIQEVQKEVVDIIVSLESNITNNEPANNKYELYQDRYTAIKKVIVNLKIRSSGLPKYTEVYKQIVLMEKSIVSLEQLHKIGFDSIDKLQTAKSGLEIQFSSVIRLQNALKKRKQ